MAEGLEAQLEKLTQENNFLNKYLALRNKCEQLQQANEKLVNRLQHVKKMTKRYKRERRQLASRLEEYGDNFKEAQVPVMWEEDQMYGVLRPPPPYPGTSTAPPTTKPKSSKKTKSPAMSLDRPSDSILSSLQPLFVAHGVPHATTIETGVPGAKGPVSKGKKIKQEPPDVPVQSSPKNAFLLFCDQLRPVIKEEYFKEYHEDIAHHELTKRLALRWNALSSDEKRVYHDLREHEKEVLEGFPKYKKSVSSAPGEVESSQYSEAALAAMQLESQSAVSSLLVKQE